MFAPFFCLQGTLKLKRQGPLELPVSPNQKSHHCQLEIHCSGESLSFQMVPERILHHCAAPRPKSHLIFHQHWCCQPPVHLRLIQNWQRTTLLEAAAPCGLKVGTVARFLPSPTWDSTQGPQVHWRPVPWCEENGPRAVSLLEFLSFQVLNSSSFFSLSVPRQGVTQSLEQAAQGLPLHKTLHCAACETRSHARDQHSILYAESPSVLLLFFRFKRITAFFFCKWNLSLFLVLVKISF